MTLLHQYSQFFVEYILLGKCTGTLNLKLLVMCLLLIHVAFCFYFISGFDVDQNGLETGAGDDSDSLGNSKLGKTVTTPPAKEKKKPFFKKVSPGFLFCFLKNFRKLSTVIY